MGEENIDYYFDINNIFLFQTNTFKRPSPDPYGGSDSPNRTNNNNINNNNNTTTTTSSSSTKNHNTAPAVSTAAKKPKATKKKKKKDPNEPSKWVVN